MRFRKTFRRTARVPRRRVDMQEYNLCRYVLGTANNPCSGEANGPSLNWLLIARPSVEAAATVEPTVQRGISFQGARFRYRYFSLASDATITFGIIRFWSGLVVAPCNSAGAPLGDGTGNLPSLGNVDGDIGLGGIRILWRGLDFQAMGTNLDPVVPQDWSRYCPVEHVKAKAFLKEGMGLYFVTEIVSPVTSIQAHTLDLSMSLALRNVQ